MSSRYRICRVTELVGITTGIDICGPNGQLKLIIVNNNGIIHAYMNQCPHTGVNLEWKPHQFLDNTGQLLQCSTHGALFEISSGLCIRGPCNGQSLERLESEIDSGVLYCYY